MFSGLRKYILPFALVYFISPLDLMPLFPADDFAVAILALMLYFGTRNVNLTQHARSTESGKEDDPDVITTSWSVVSDE